MIKTPIGSEGLKWPQEVTICILKCQEIPGEIIELSTLETKDYSHFKDSHWLLNQATIS